MPDAPRPSAQNSADDRGEKIEFSGGRGSDPSSSKSLPLQLTSFVGREREKGQVEEILEGYRLLTLTGAGGSGKTRLALAVSSGMTDRFEDGVWWVELAPISDPSLVPQAVAQAMMIREEPGRSLTQTIATDLATSELLLILDNCEHLIEASADLVDALLRSCPGVCILATSRELLGIPGEAQFVVPPLSLPDPLRMQEAEDQVNYEAASLFVERARAARPQFTLTRDNAMTVAQICHRLDGMPLAIELAASKVRVLSAEQIASRLDDRFALLTGGGRTTLPHHATLEATVEWSHDLLSAEEKILFRRLSVFSGGFTLEAAEAICPGDDIREAEILGLLTSLVDKSLVQVGQQGEVSRYGLLETIRQYALGQLGESGEAGLVRERHARYFLALVEEAEPELRGARQGEWLRRLDRDFDNFRAALSWALEQEDAELRLRLCSSLGEFWHMLGRHSEGRRWLDEALAKEGNATETTRARALVMAGHMAWEQGDFVRSLYLSEEGLALFRKAGDVSGAVVALYVLGAAALFQNDLERATALTEEALALQRASGDSIGAARSLPILGTVAQLRRDYDRAIALYEEGLEVAREVGDDFAVALSLVIGSSTYLGTGDNLKALELNEESLKLSQRLSMMRLLASSLNVSAALAGAQGQAERSARLWGAAESLRERLGIVFSPFEHTYFEPYISAARGRLDESSWDAAWAEGHVMPLEQAVEYALERRPAEQEPQDGPPPKPSYPGGLSAREVEVLGLVARGMTNAQIAGELFVSPRTVNWHLGSVYRKLGFSSRAEATRFAVEHDLLT